MASELFTWHWYGSRLLLSVSSCGYTHFFFSKLKSALAVFCGGSGILDELQLFDSPCGSEGPVQGASGDS